MTSFVARGPRCHALGVPKHAPHLVGRLLAVLFSLTQTTAIAQPRGPEPGTEAPTRETETETEPSETTEEPAASDDASLAEPSATEPEEELPVDPAEPDEGYSASATVSGAPLDALGGSVHVVTDAELRALDYTDPDRVMARIPGVYVRSEDGYGLRPNVGMRGANSHRSRKITMLEDGVLQGYAPYSSPSIFSLTPMTRVVGIDAIRGPASILYGPQTVAGAIDFRTRDVPEGRTGEVDYAFGVNHWSRAHFFAGASNRHVGASLEGLYTRADGFQRVDFTGGSNGFELGDFALRAFYRGDPRADLHQRLSAKLVYQVERSNETYLGLTDADFAADPYRRYVAGANDEMNRQRTQAELRYELEIGARTTLTAVAYRSDVARTWYRLDRFRAGPSINDVLTNPTSATNAGYYDLLRGATNTPDLDHAFIYVNNDWRYVSEGVQVDARFHATTGPVTHDLRAGARVHYDSIDRHIRADGWEVLGQRLTPDGQPGATQNVDLAQTLAFSAYVHYALGVGPVTLTPGLRTEWMSMGFTDDVAHRDLRNQLVALLPGASVSLDASDEVRLFAGVHRGFSPPLPQDAGSSSPETSVNYELGGRYVTADGTRAEATAFLSDYDNMTSFCTLTAGCTSIDHAYNAGRALVFGVELAGSHTFHAGRFLVPVQVAYTYTGSSFRSAFTSSDPQLGVVHVGDRLPYVPVHEGSLSAGLVLPEKFSVHLQGTMIGSMREEAGQGSGGRRTDAQYLLDATADVHLVGPVTLFVRGENLLAQSPLVSRRPWGARPGRPFQAQIGMRIAFR